MLRWSLCVTLLLAVPAVVLAQKPKYQSPVVNLRTPGHAVDIDVDVTGAKKLFLVVTDAGGYSADWADWVEPRFVTPQGEIKLTDLKWLDAKQGWGKTLVGKNAEGMPLKVNGKPVAYGIGTHANSIIAYDIPRGATRFKAQGGLDNGGTDQQSKATSVQFAVYLDKAPVIGSGNASGGGDQGGRTPDLALAGLDTGEGLEVQLFAAEPLLLSPSNIDVDHRGRVWVCEVVNYRHRAGSRPAGDRILILEDTNGDGQADKQTVYYQGKDVDTALGICVLGNKVLVSVAPNVIVFTDENGDDKPDRKEMLFTKAGQPQHDHSTHAFIFGPDGKLYFNVGNTGGGVSDKDGKPITDLMGNKVSANGNPYRQGLAFRCNPDGSEFEVLGHNFRNNFELTVDSFGTVWQSDNDDDGNRSVRINYVMEYGNYGYTDEFTGAGWKSPRTGANPNIQKMHWHQNDPGVVPNLLVTGAGSPTGICVYEGDLLPERFRNQVIHCDAGPNVVRAYPVEKDGAGYTAEMDDLLVGSRDKWFRPSDVCVAPDGSLIVADWYDPGVGGHRMGDIEKGRLFRIAVPGAKYSIPKFDFSTAEGAAAALANPNLEARYLAWTALHKMQDAAQPALTKLWQSNDPRLRARALWLLGKIAGRGQEWADKATADPNPDIRITGIRLARELKLDVLPIVKRLAPDDSPQVRRECAIALHGLTGPEAAAQWADLAVQHDGQDRWYLEALGIGASHNWDAAFAAWRQKSKSELGPGGADIVWRARTAAAIPLLGELIAKAAATSDDDVARYFRALDFHRGPEAASAKQEVLVRSLAVNGPQQAAARKYALERLGNVDITKNAALKTALDKTLEASRGTGEYLDLVRQFKLADRDADVLALAQQGPDEQLGVDAMKLLVESGRLAAVEQALAGEPKTAAATAKALGNTADGRATPILIKTLDNAQAPQEVREQAVRSMAKLKNGADELLARATAGKLDGMLKFVAAFELQTSAFPQIRDAAAKLFPLPAGKDNKPLPPVTDLLKMKGSATQGQLLFAKGECAKCHIVNNQGKEVGPNLSEIGSKLSREAMLESIIYPSAGISHNYELYAVELTSGNVANGVLVSQTDQEITLRGADAITRVFKKSDIDQMVKQKISIMPADLHKTMTPQELMDVVDYMMTLKKKS